MTKSICLNRGVAFICPTLMFILFESWTVKLKISEEMNDNGPPNSTNHLMTFTTCMHVLTPSATLVTTYIYWQYESAAPLSIW